eukprot:CAMPEP_0206521508 /NCGR_PEP_ID=MMETSP0324_2-20121206/66372_1 /ASSEMBLY_ACC=CAM_ASM_000836 /TAXON_ID=2866 /ORGANISM="Crypthecodinium cohnii, Strain Seligo" /LENGTH=92 /DNA_ID=CAMNT_0054015381 /DNA_START=25 /DNA_END=299 /DNA_ORIENTATION=+
MGNGRDIASDLRLAANGEDNGNSHCSWVAAICWMCFMATTAALYSAGVVFQTKSGIPTAGLRFNAGDLSAQPSAAVTPSSSGSVFAPTWAAP